MLLLQISATKDGTCMSPRIRLFVQGELLVALEITLISSEGLWLVPSLARTISFPVHELEHSAECGSYQVEYCQ